MALTAAEELELAAIEKELAASKQRREQAFSEYNANLKAGAIDVGKTLVAAPGKVVTGFAGLPGDVSSMMTAGRQKFVDPLLPPFVSQFLNEPNPADQFTGGGFRTSAELRKMAEAATGPWHDPESAVAKGVDTAAQTGLSLGRSWMRAPKQAALLTAGTTAGTEAGGALSEDSPWGRFLGGAVGGGLPALLMGARNKPGAMVKEAFAGVKPAAIASGVNRQAQGAEAGVPLMAQEALDRLHELAASSAARSPSAAAIYRDFLENNPEAVRRGLPGSREEQVNAAVDKFLLQPTGWPHGIPSEHAARAQQTATDALERARKWVGDQSGPKYRAAATDQVPHPEIQKLIDRAQAMADADTTGILKGPVEEFIGHLTKTPATPALPGTRGTPGSFAPSNLPGGQGRGPWVPGTPGTPPTPGAPPTYATDIANLDRARKFWREKVELPFMADKAIPQETSTKITDLSMELKKAMQTSSPAWEEARALHQRLSRAAVEPLEQSGVGKIAGEGYDPSVSPPVNRMLEAVFGKHVAPEDIRVVHQALNKENPRAFPGIAQTLFKGELDAAKDSLSSVQRSTAGAKLKDALYGSPEKAARTDEILRGVAEAHGLNPDEVVKGARNMFEVLERTGTPTSTVPATAGRGKLTAEMERTKTGQVLSTFSVTPLKPLGRLWERMIGEKRWVEIANAMTHPDGVRVLAQMAKLHPDGLSARYLTSQMLNFGKAAASTGQQEE